MQNLLKGILTGVIMMGMFTLGFVVADEFFPTKPVLMVGECFYDPENNYVIKIIDVDKKNYKTIIKNYYRYNEKSYDIDYLNKRSLFRISCKTGERIRETRR